MSESKLILPNGNTNDGPRILTPIGTELPLDLPKEPEIPTLNSAEIKKHMPTAEILNDNVTQMSFIEPHEEADAKVLINKLLGFEPPRVCGWQMAVKIYIRPSEISEFIDENGNKKALYLPDSISAHDKFKNCVALVVSQGPECYTGPRFQEHWTLRAIRKIFGRCMKPSLKQPRCKVGDWVVFPRNGGGYQINYRGYAMQIINDDMVGMVVEDPTWVTRD